MHSNGHSIWRAALRGGPSGPSLNRPLLAFDNATPNEGATVVATATVDDGDGATTSAVELHKQGTGKVADMVDAGGGSWTHSLTDIVLADGGNYFAVRITDLGNRNSVSVALAPVAITATLTPDVLEADEGDTVTYTVAVNYGTLEEARVYNGAELLDTLTEAPWTYAALDVAPGTLTLRVEVECTESGARVIQATAAGVTVAAEAPTLVAPEDDQEISVEDDAVPWEATTSYPSRTVRMALLIDDVEIDSDETDPYSGTFDATIYSIGQMLNVKARRYLTTGGFIDSAVACVDVVDASAVVPTPTLTAPANNVFLAQGQSVTVSATVDGDVDRIDWVLNPGMSETVVATDSSSPYSQTWVASQATGAHTLVARAWVGASSQDSDPIDLTINTPQSIFGSKLYAYYDASLGVTHSSGAITGVADQSGNGRNLTVNGTVTLNGANSNWNDIPTFSFGGSGDLTSAGAASIWNLLHTGAGAATLIPLRYTSDAAVQTVWSTKLASSASRGARLTVNGASGQVRAISIVSNGSANSTAGGGTDTLPANTLHSTYWYHKTSETPDMDLRYPSGTSQGTSSTSVSSDDAAFTLTIGRRPGASTFDAFVGSIPWLIFLNDLPSAGELASYVAWAQARVPGLTA